MVSAIVGFNINFMFSIYVRFGYNLKICLS